MNITRMKRSRKWQRNGSADRKIKWNKLALQDYESAITFIRRISDQNAEKVNGDILTRIRSLAIHPEIYPPDKYKMGNNGHFRVFELRHYRVSYLIKKDEIIIARFRHTSMAPQKY